MRAIASILPVLLLSCLIAGCRQEQQLFHAPTAPASGSRIISLYHQLKTGMTRSQVQTIVGEPLSSLRQTSGEEQCYYVKKPERIMESHESPMMLGGISVKYKDGKLIEKMYNPQWVKREHREAYEQRRNSEQDAPADAKNRAAEL